MWIEASLGNTTKSADLAGVSAEPCAFEDLFVPVVDQAEALLWSNSDARVFYHFSESARLCLRRSLLDALSNLSTPAIYERFTKARKGNGPPSATPAQSNHSSRPSYDRFVAEMKTGGFRSLFEDKPGLLRLMALVTRQWIDTSRELVLRLDADLPTIGHTILNSGASSQITEIEGDLSDPHNGGHAVQIISFEDGSKIVYKPKDLQLDVSWYALVERLNRATPPIELRAVRAIAREGYGWTEFISHSGCADQEGCKRFFRRAGAWLALFHCFAATDMHQENIIAAGEHPVPIDLETILQAAPEQTRTQDPEGQALDAAMEIVANSIMTVGLLPAYGRGPDNNVFAMGGMTADWNYKTKIKWNNINSDEMQPTKVEKVGTPNPNLPHVDGRYARFGDHIDDFIAGFATYAKFLQHQSRDLRQGYLLNGFAGIPVRKVIRLTRFYYMLLMRLKDHRSMDDGVVWSAQADFVARLADWEKSYDPLWPLQKAERSALLALNVPYFVSMSDGNETTDTTGISIRTEAISGMDRARARLRDFDEREIAWQIEVINANTNSIRKSRESTADRGKSHLSWSGGDAHAATRDDLIAEADRIAGEISHQAIRRGPGAAWIGLDWLGDAEVFQLMCLGPDLYNGASGIGVFLAAHAAVTGCKPSAELALAGLSHLRKDLKGRNAARQARALGLGGVSS